MDGNLWAMALRSWYRPDLVSLTEAMKSRTPQKSIEKGLNWVWTAIPLQLEMTKYPKNTVSCSKLQDAKRLISQEATDSAVCYNVFTNLGVHEGLTRNWKMATNCWCERIIHELKHMQNECFSSHTLDRVVVYRNVSVLLIPAITECNTLLSFSCVNIGPERVTNWLECSAHKRLREVKWSLINYTTPSSCLSTTPLHISYFDVDFALLIDSFSSSFCGAYS